MTLEALVRSIVRLKRERDESRQEHLRSEEAFGKSTARIRSVIGQARSGKMVLLTAYDVVIISREKLEEVAGSKLAEEENS